MRDRFPVLLSGNRAYEKLRGVCFTSVPWGLIAQHTERLRKNHDASPELIAARGGLTPCEIVAAMRDVPVEDAPPPFAAVRELQEAIDAWGAA